MSVDHSALLVGAPRSPWKRYLSLGLAVLTCPCHLPLILVVLGGTALGGWLRQYSGVVFLAMLGVFGLALLHGLGALSRRQASGSGAQGGRDIEAHPMAEESWSDR